MNHTAFDAATESWIHHVPPSGERDVPLGIQEVSAKAGDHHSTPVLLLHGAMFGSAMFDIPVPGYSLQKFLAGCGWQNFALDIRGYGRSMPAQVMKAPAYANEPFARLDAAVEDLATGVKFVLKQTCASKVHIISFSWGTVATCIFAAHSPGLVAKLALYAPLYGEVNETWIKRICDPQQPNQVNPHLGAYCWVGEPDICAHWDADIPRGANKADFRDDRIMRAILNTLSAGESRQYRRPERSFKAPTGAMVDLFEIFNGRPLYNPRRIKTPTLIIRGHDDTTSTQSDAMTLFRTLGTKNKRYVAISPGSHFLCVERNARDLFAEFDLFLRQ